MNNALATNDIKQNVITNGEKMPDTTFQSSKSSPIHRSVLYMTCSMSLLFMGYEFARSGLMALITSTSSISTSLSTSSTNSSIEDNSSNNKSSSYYSIAMAFVTPFSVVLLLWHGQLLQRKGPRLTLRTTTLACAYILSLSALILYLLDSLILSSSLSEEGDDERDTPFFLKTNTRFVIGQAIWNIIVWSTFVFQNCYAKLLYTQHWSFLGMVLPKLCNYEQNVINEQQRDYTHQPQHSHCRQSTKENEKHLDTCTTSTSTTNETEMTRNQQADKDVSSKKEFTTEWFTWIAGVTSLSSMTAGYMISTLLSRKKHLHYSICFVLSPIGLVGVAGLLLFLTFYLGDEAYQLSEKHNFGPIQRQDNNNDDDDDNTDSKAKRTLSSKNIITFLKKVHALFIRVPILAYLFLEVCSFQIMLTVINLCFTLSLTKCFSVDIDRAAWTGKTYAFSNGTSAFVQFLILPMMLRKMQVKWIWRVLPILPLFFLGMNTLILSIEISNDNDENVSHQQSLEMITLCLQCIKTIDYAARNVLHEIVFASLDYESQFFGKEVISILGNKIGKSIISLVLSCIPILFQMDTTIDQLNTVAIITCVAWSFCSFRLSCFKKETEKEENMTSTETTSSSVPNTKKDQ